MSTATLERLRALRARTAAHPEPFETITRHPSESPNEHRDDSGRTKNRHPGESRGPFGLSKTDSGFRRNDGRVACALSRYPVAPSVSDTSESLIESLSALRRLTGLRRASDPAAPLARRREALPFTHRRLDTHLPGTEIARGVRRIDHPPIPLANTPLSFDRPEFDDVASEHLLAIDTETTGLAGGTGTRAFVIGIAAWRHDRIVVTQWLLTELRGEPVLLAALTEALGKHADGMKSPTTLLSYNGKSYDLPLLRTRWRLARQPDPTQALPHLDLLHPVRRAYRGVWENCRLATIERRLLGIVREDDLPGAEAPAAFTRWLREGDAGNLIRVVEHNRQDVVSLVRLAERMGAIWPQVAANPVRG